MKKWIKENKNDIIVFLIYAIVSLLLIYFHENWRDEAQAWLLARDLNIKDLFLQMKYEGHFMLWYLILMPFAKLGFPYFTTNIISWIITAISAWLILKYAPFKKYKKYLFIFSFPMIYLYPVISRCYCLIPLAITLIAIFYPTRNEKPYRYILSIILLTNTHVIMFGMVGILTLEFIIDQIKNKTIKEKNKKIIRSLIMLLILLILSILPLMGCLTTNKNIGSSESFSVKLLDMIVIEPINMIYYNYSFYCNNEYIISCIIIISIAFMILEAFQNKKDFFAITIIFLWQYMIYAFIFSSSYQRASTSFFIILFYRWIRKYKQKEKIESKNKKINEMITKILLTILLIANIINGLIYAYFEVNNNYSCAYQVGKFINNNINDECIMVTGNQVEFCSSIIPYVSKNLKFYYIQENIYFTYATWDEMNQAKPYEDFMKQLYNKFGKNKKVYYIYTPLKCVPESDEEIVNKMTEKGIFKEIFRTNEVFSYSIEEYIIYEIDFNVLNE